MPYADPAGAGAVTVSAGAPPSYQQGTVLALVTWSERDDPHWFGARIPGRVASVEFVEVAGGGDLSYRRFAGDELGETHPGWEESARRAAFLSCIFPLCRCLNCG